MCWWLKSLLEYVKIVFIATGMHLPGELQSCQRTRMSISDTHEHDNKAQHGTLNPPRVKKYMASQFALFTLQSLVKITGIPGGMWTGVSID